MTAGTRVRLSRIPDAANRSTRYELAALPAEHVGIVTHAGEIRVFVVFYDLDWNGLGEWWLPRSALRAAT